MYMKLIISLSLVGLVLAGTKPVKESRKPREYYGSYEEQPQYADYGLVSEISVPLAHVDSAVAHSHHHVPLKPGFSSGGGLVSIARGSADQARTALASQHASAGQAAYMAKNQLAQTAAQSAATANAAFAGKQIIFLGLQQQSKDARTAVEGEARQLQQAARAAQAARNSAQQAMHQVQVITAALNAAQATQDHAAQAAAEAAAELAAQTSMLGQAKARAQSIDEQLEASRIDYEATQSARDKAQAAAQQAQNNAAAAAEHAAQSAATNAHPAPSVAEEEDGHPAAALEVAAHVEAQAEHGHHEPVHHETYLQPQLEDLEHNQALLVHRNSLHASPGLLTVGHEGHGHGHGHGHVDEYDYKGYY